MDWLEKSRLLLSRLPIKSRETHRMVPFQFNPNQVKRFKMIREQWKRDGKIRVLDLKARRVGVSAQTDAMLWCYGLAFPNMNIKIVAHLAGSADELFRVPSDLSRAFPSFDSQDIQMRRIFFPHAEGQSQITLATAGTPAAGRGGTLSALHLSEAAYYPSDDSFVSMISSVSKGPGSIIVIESTANGKEGPGAAFAEYWEQAVKGKNGYVYCFLSWLEDPACIRPSEEAEDAPVDDLEKELMSPPFNASREQIAWMRRTKADDCRDLENKWLQDYPHCPEVAFQVSGSPAFARPELAYAERTIRDPMCRGKFIRTGATTFKFVKKDDGPVHIWRFPFDKNGKPDGMWYYVGADSAAGVDEGDFAAYAVLCGQTGELAARFAEQIDPEMFADQLDMVGRWYNNAMLNPELTGGLGRWTLIKLRDVFRYPKIYTWKGRDDRKRGKVRSIALGFEMNQATRRLIIDAMRSGIRMSMRNEPGGLIVNDRALMAQMGLCTLKEWRWEVERGHDDILVAYAIACLTREQYPPPRMTFAPKSTYDEGSPQSRLADLGINPQQSGEKGTGLHDEMSTIFLQEMRRMMRSAGLNASMRGTGKRQRDRLVGI
jgi:hypothetical protein